MENNILVAKGESDIYLRSALANRHGLIAGATGTGKTVTLKVLAEGFSRIGVPVFLADVKGDLAGLTFPGTQTDRITERVRALRTEPPLFAGSPVVFWDVYGELGHPLRATVSDIGPLLLARLLNLNETQSAVLSVAFKIADDNGLLLLDRQDLQAILAHVAEHRKEYAAAYGAVSPASVGATQRNLTALSEQGAERFFGEPALDINDLLQTDRDGRGVISILAAEKLIRFPQAYATTLLWLLSELFEELPEVGDAAKPKLVFFFDEAHLLFNDAPKVLLSQIEQVVRLVRSKGVGIYFVTQNPLDIPDTVLGQLGNRVQHALRAFTAKDQKAVKAAAETFRSDGREGLAAVITQLAVGEALVSFLDEDGVPEPAQRSLIYPPRSRLGTISPAEREAVVRKSLLFGTYEHPLNRESAFEMLQKKTQQKVSELPPAPSKRSSNRQTPVEAMVTSAARSIGSQVGRQIIRGILGAMMRR